MFRRRISRNLGTSVAIIFVAMTSCSSPAPVKPLAMSVAAGIQGDLLRIHGTIAVPDGALVDYVAYQASAPANRVSGNLGVADGRFDGQALLPRWPPGKITVDANFQIGRPGTPQPAPIVALYGQDGERMTGPSVVKGGGSFRAATASTTVDYPKPQ